MKRSVGQAAFLAYLGALLLIAGFYPTLAQRVEGSRLLHALLHVELFIGAAFLVYGLETLRSLARRHRRMIS
ncbi:MAG: hypothetical protein K6T26_04205 [Alicyclobacillus sp.]|nr:hypothetical protein [Alicyclobacillus sp.]